MRSSFVLGSALAATFVVLGVFACGGDDDTRAVADAGKVLADGAVVAPDGARIEQPTPQKSSKVNATDETVDVLGTTRRYVLAVPKTYDAGRKYPLIVALHGDGDTGPGFRAALGFDDLAGDDAIVAYPTGAVDLGTAYDQNSDQLLSQAVIDAVKAKFSIDGAKVWGFGYSKGGFMLNEIACRKPGVFKAMAVHASGAPDAPKAPTEGIDFPVCAGILGLPVLATEGQFDMIHGTEYSAQFWALTNGCSRSQRSATTPAPCQRHDSCPAGKPVVYCVAPGFGHTPIWDQAAAVSWGFFNAL